MSREWSSARAQAALALCDAPGSEGVVDMLADLMHHCTEEAIDFEGCLQIAVRHYLVELEELREGETV
jgi:hypothetical protein